jgi:hypothetical protein
LEIEAAEVTGDVDDFADESAVAGAIRCRAAGERHCLDRVASV